MRIERLRNEIEVFNKLNGKMYKVVEVTPDRTGLAKEMLEDGTLGEASATIDESNCLAFRILNDPAPYPAPEGYTVSDGVLMKDGKPACEQGQLSISGILAKQPGYLILTAKNETTKDGMVELYSYQPCRDRFVKLTTMPSPELIGYAGKDQDTAVIAYNQTETKKEKQEDGSEKETELFVSAAVLSIREGRVMTNCDINDPIDISTAILKTIPDSEKFTVFIASDEETDEGFVLVPRKDRCWIRVGGSYVESKFTMDGDISADWSYVYQDFVVKNDKSLQILSKDLKISSPCVAKLKGYDTLIDITREEYSYKLTFSNENYEFKTLTSKSTRDRGYIVTVE